MNDGSNFLKKFKIIDFEKFPETKKIIIKGIIKGFSNNTTKKPKIPFDMYSITEDILMEFKNDFGFKEENKAHSDAYKKWMKNLGLDYNKDRPVVQKIIRGIYEYSNGKLDYRNRRMRAEVTYEQKSTIEKKENLEKTSLLREGVIPNAATIS